MEYCSVWLACNIECAKYMFGELKHQPVIEKLESDAWIIKDDTSSVNNPFQSVPSQWLFCYSL